MSEVVDLTLLASGVQEIAREVRLMRLQVDNLASRLSGQDGRLGGIEGRIGAMEQSFHDLLGEVSRSFGQMQQQATRQEKRTEAVDAGLTALRAELADSTARIIQAIGAP
jgi:chromosome segregation ATPase